MRQVIHRYCVNQGYNMTTNYGVTNECEVIPFSCVNGNNMYFLYGHYREDFIKTSHDSLHIIMLRDPLSWILSRIQHEIRKSVKNNKDKSLMVNKTFEIHASIASFGGKYFNFLDQMNYDLSSLLFKLTLQTSVGADNQNKALDMKIIKPYLSNEDLSTSSTHKYNLLELQTILSSHIEYLFAKNTVVLLTEYYTESMQILDNIFQTKHFTSFQNGQLNKLNEAFEWQGKAIAGTYDELKIVPKLLQIQYVIYDAAMREFRNQYRDLLRKKSGNG
jgi:hypothetical protein